MAGDGDDDKGGSYDPDLDKVIAEVEVEGTKLFLQARSYAGGSPRIGVFRKGSKKTYGVKRLSIAEMKAVTVASSTAFAPDGAFVKLKDKPKVEEEE